MKRLDIVVMVGLTAWLVVQVAGYSVGALLGRSLCWVSDRVGTDWHQWHEYFICHDGAGVICLRCSISKKDLTGR